MVYIVGFVMVVLAACWIYDRRRRVKTDLSERIQRGSGIAQGQAAPYSRDYNPPDVGGGPGY